MSLNSFLRSAFVSKHLPHFNAALFFIWKTPFLGFAWMKTCAIADRIALS
uniref:Uncharacterized protein n=1 Tax=Arundo donax TaxID=35708 RepID=A0A0A9B587_ARUDO